MIPQDTIEALAAKMVKALTAEERGQLIVAIDEATGILLDAMEEEAR